MPLTTSFTSILVNSLFLVGIILSIVSLFLPLNYILNITSYSLFIAGLLVLMIKIQQQQTNITNDIFKFIQVFLLNVGPFILLLGLIIYLLYLTIRYKTIISSGHVSSSYSIFNNISILFLCLQIGVFYQAMNQPSYKDKQVIPVMYNTFIYLLTLLNFIVVLTISNILKYFSTDGWTNPF
jgi:hypothetical protein